MFIPRKLMDVYRNGSTAFQYLKAEHIVIFFLPCAVPFFQFLQGSVTIIVYLKKKKTVSETIPIILFRAENNGE